MSDERRVRQEQRKQEEATPSSVRRFVLFLHGNWKKLLLALGISSIPDFAKEIARGKLVDWAYEHFGVFGRWLVGYPLAFVTLALCVIILLVVVVTIRESLSVESLAIVDERGVRYTRPSVSPRWTISLLAVAIVCICVISYGTFRYYQITVGHFKANPDTNVMLPVLPLSPPPKIPDHPPSMFGVFDGDFPNLIRAKNDLLLEGTNFRVVQQVYLDFVGKAKFVGFYVPVSGDPVSGVNTYKVCMMLADQTEVALRDLSRNIKMRSGFGLNGNTIDELTFTGRVLIYHEDVLSIVQKAGIINAFKAKQSDVQFLGQDYLANQTDIWVKRRDAAQGH